MDQRAAMLAALLENSMNFGPSCGATSISGSIRRSSTATSRESTASAVAVTLEVNHKEMLNYFDHRCTDAISKGLSSIIQAAKRTVRRFRNLAYFKAVIYMNLDKLKYPVIKSCATH